jgi:hypothetical protein
MAILAGAYLRVDMRPPGPLACSNTATRRPALASAEAQESPDTAAEKRQGARAGGRHI